MRQLEELIEEIAEHLEVSESDATRLVREMLVSERLNPNPPMDRDGWREDSGRG